MFTKNLKIKDLEFIPTLRTNNIIQHKKKDKIMAKNVSETNTENIFREFYGTNVFLEKSAIPDKYGFLSKQNTKKKGYPDFFLHDSTKNYFIVVEAKALKQSEAEEEVKWYMQHNNYQDSAMVGIAISGQHLNQIKATYYYKKNNDQKIEELQTRDKLLTLENLDKTIAKKFQGEKVTEEELINTLKQLNKRFHDDKKVRNTDRSLFFSGLLIALSDNNFRNNYKGQLAPLEADMVSKAGSVPDSHYIKKLIVESIETRLSAIANNLSKIINWKDRFSFIKSVDYSLEEYKEILSIIEEKVYFPFSFEEKQDILGKAYKIFLSRSGNRAEDKNIILTPDHIKELMVKLSRLNIDDVVIDTCMGSGGFLMEAMEVMVNMAKDDEEKINSIRTKQLIGFEIDYVLFALACSNMFLHGDGRSNLLYRSSLLDSDDDGALVNSDDKDLFNYIKEVKPNKCIINPPYENSNPIDFTMQAIDYLEPNGKLIIIMPTPTLSMNKKNKTKKLLESAKLDFVIKMPYGLFSEQKRTVNTSIFGFTKTRHQHNDQVLFVNLKHDGFESIQHKGRIDKDNKWNDIENKILDIINNFKEEEGLSIKKNIFLKDESGDYILNPSGIDIREKADSMVRFSELFDIDKGLKADQKLQSTKNEYWGEYDFITAADEWKKHTSYTHDEEALIYAVSASGSLGKCQYVNGKFIPSDLVVVLTPKKKMKDKINLQFYNEYLNKIRDDIVDSLASGASKLTINRNYLKDYYIELFPIEVQNSFVENSLNKYNEHKAKLTKLKSELEKELDDLLKSNYS